MLSDGSLLDTLHSGIRNQIPDQTLNISVGSTGQVLPNDVLVRMSPEDVAALLLKLASDRYNWGEFVKLSADDATVAILLMPLAAELRYEMGACGERALQDTFSLSEIENHLTEACEELKTHEDACVGATHR